MSTPLLQTPLSLYDQTPLPYERQLAKLAQVRAKLGRQDLTLAEKVLFTHVADVEALSTAPGTYLQLFPDRVAMQDATAQMAVLQFINSGLPQTAVPATVHCDHLIDAKCGAQPDMEAAKRTNAEVYDFLSTAARKYGMGFWGPGSGIIHQIVLENYAFPGGMIIGTDSHTPNAGGLGMIAVGVGGADAVDVLAGFEWELPLPKICGVHLTGRLQGWASPKDLILHLAKLLTVKGGTGYVLEYYGEGVETLSATGMATICNMGAEVGATCSLFPYTASMRRYLAATGRSSIAAAADQVADQLLRADANAHYAKVIELDLATVPAYLNGPHSPDRGNAVATMKAACAANNWPTKLSVGLIGSCTNSSYEDLTRAVSVIRQARAHGITQAKAHFYISPGSERIRATIERDGLLREFTEFGGVVLANACGPCIGQWKRQDVEEMKQLNCIVTSFNRNFEKRNDGCPNTLAFVASPEMVTAMAIAGQVTFDPTTDTLEDAHTHAPFQLACPQGQELPATFELGDTSLYQGPIPTAERAAVQFNINPASARLQLLVPFQPYPQEAYREALVLIKAQGKCTTDHISPAGPWLTYRGHLNNIAQNMLSAAKGVDVQVGATQNALTKTKVNLLKNHLTGQFQEVWQVAKAYQEAHRGWVVVGDENYGEGSSREHAALEPRLLGCVAVVVRSFARIHEGNLKKQGVLPLTFANPADYDRLQADDKVTLRGVEHLTPETQIVLVCTHANGTVDEIPVRHTLNATQIAWINAGSALTLIAAEQAAKQQH
ncbi:putative Aconitate hydratase [Paratrimastix pyriformis]|uniref:Aconitate hydratase, mitochondrial n=1 Tax=Paratrimastix pyriformis TaxID=342808 RepID=B0F458_9EUKA|nr:aconitase [Paratrimastix pyriformis]KAJ4458844.1 putative Aconitate hydratase [Paratrimastix pyriformis]